MDGSLLVFSTMVPAILMLYRQAGLCQAGFPVSCCQARGLGAGAPLQQGCCLRPDTYNSSQALVYNIEKRTST